MTTSDAQIARKWAWEYMLCNEGIPESARDAEYMAARHILATTAPPTMSDVEWDDEVHAGLCAVYTAEDVTVRMIARSLMYTDCIECCWLCAGIMKQGRLPRELLTPLPGTKINLTPRRASFSNEGVETGNENRNEGVETGNDHPTELTTEEDYENAPTGTIAADDDGAAVKAGDGTWRWTGSELSYRSDDLCYGESDPMTVVRWGK